MLCQNCSKRTTCQKPCEKLEKDLAKVTVKRPRETPKEESELESYTFYPLSWAEMASYHQEQVNISILSPIQNKCLQLFYFEGLTYKQIAYRLSNQYQRILSHQVSYQLRLAKRKILQINCINKGGKTDEQ